MTDDVKKAQAEFQADLQELLNRFEKHFQSVVLPTLAQTFITLAIVAGGQKRVALKSLDRIWIITANAMRKTGRIP